MSGNPFSPTKLSEVDGQRQWPVIKKEVGAIGQHRDLPIQARAWHIYYKDLRVVGLRYGTVRRAIAVLTEAAQKHAS